jgi:transcriptional regulator with XRE-family HTH domain
MESKTVYYIEALSFAFEQKKLKNQQFSLRAFARDLDINSGTLSRILKGERIPSMTLGRQLALSLKLSERECDLFLNSLASAK